MSKAYSRVFDIPELVDLFTSYLSPADLLVCVQVNSHWNKCFIPKLWHTIDDTLQSWEQILFTCHSDPSQIVTHSKLSSFKPSSVTDGKDEDWLRAIFAKYGQYIRKLKIHWAILVDAASTSGVCTNLQDLEIKFQWSNAEKLYWSRGPKDSGAIVEHASAAIKLAQQASHIEAMNTLQSKHLFKPPDNFSPPYHCNSITEAQLEHGWIFTQHYWTLVLGSPDLRRLYLSNEAVLQWSVQSKEFFFLVLSGLKELEDVCAFEYLTSADIWRLQEVATAVETVTVPVGHHLFGQDGSVATESGHAIPRQNSGIKTLRFLHYNNFEKNTVMVSLFSGPSRQEVLTILSLLPNLRHLELTDVRDDGTTLSPTIPDVPALPARGFDLTTLQISDCHNLETFLHHLPNLRILKVNNFSNEAFEALAACCKNLQVLEWMHNPTCVNDRLQGRPEFDGLHKFLVSCSTLKVFDGIERFVNAEDMIREPWACQGIEKLRCRIVGVVRLTKDEQAIYEKPSTSDETIAVLQTLLQSREQQGLVYERLASLKHLKHLDLGFENRSPRLYRALFNFIREFGGDGSFLDEEPTPDTLELSLESGLGQLGTLKNLEMIGFEAIDHRIKEKELEWMAKSWPKLKLMYGLAEHSMFEFKQDERKKELKRFMKMLRPDVEHGSLFTPE
ncbi:MAG: hypothetical protein J3Q66DRAFT_192325 [Benniella sp.]|nr:MAG: hypothetical protein J3Q66DRAFT_192325 [Benniella sp.]